MCFRDVFNLVLYWTVTEKEMLLRRKFSHMRWSTWPHPHYHIFFLIITSELNINVLTKKPNKYLKISKNVLILKKIPTFSPSAGKSRIWILLAEYDAHNNKKKWQLLIVGRHFYAEMKHLTLLWWGCIFSISLKFIPYFYAVHASNYF